MSPGQCRDLLTAVTPLPTRASRRRLIRRAVVTGAGSANGFQLATAGALRSLSLIAHFLRKTWSSGFFGDEKPPAALHSRRRAYAAYNVNVLICRNGGVAVKMCRAAPAQPAKSAIGEQDSRL